MRKFKSRFLASVLSAGLVISGIPGTALVSNAAPNKDESADGEYELVWSDEFDDDELNLEDWNVEAHDPGWVNAELQRYVSKDDMEDNIVIDDGVLSIYPTVEEKNAAGEPVDLLDGFDGWTGSVTDSTVVEGGKATITIENVGSDPWDVQYQKAGLTLVEGHDYKLSFKAKAADARTIQVGCVDTSNNYATVGEANMFFNIGTEEYTYFLTFTATASGAEAVSLQFNLGNLEQGTSIATTLELSDISLVDETASAAPVGAEVLKGDGFDDNLMYGPCDDGEGSTVIADGNAVVTVTNPGSANNGYQLQQQGLTLKTGHAYRLSFNAVASVTRSSEITFIIQKTITM